MSGPKSVLFCVAIACAFLVACGGDSPSMPSPPPATTPPPAPPAPPPAPVLTWSASGSIVETASRAPIAGAVISPSWELAAVTAAADGTFQIGAILNPPTTPYDLTLSAPGFITRKAWVTWQFGPRTNVVLDLIRDSAPFSQQFYGEFVRGNYDSEGAPWRLFRLPTAPRFYIRTVDETGAALPPEIFPLIHQAIQRAVPDFTGGRYQAVIETGPEARPEAPGWILVNVVRFDEDDTACGRAFIGAEAGRITLMYDRPGCSCGSLKVAGPVVAHEVGHALGFFHVSDRKSIMYPYAPGTCPVADPSPQELYHAGIAYSRPRGNTEPDNDPSTGPLSTGDAMGRRILVKN